MAVPQCLAHGPANLRYCLDLQYGSSHLVLPKQEATAMSSRLSLNKTVLLLETLYIQAESPELDSVNNTMLWRNRIRQRDKITRARTQEAKSVCHENPSVVRSGYAGAQ